VSLTGVKNSLLWTVRIDRTYGPDVRAQKNDVRTYGRSLRPVRTGSVYRPLAKLDICAGARVPSYATADGAGLPTLPGQVYPICVIYPRLGTNAVDLLLPSWSQSVATLRPVPTYSALSK